MLTIRERANSREVSREDLAGIKLVEPPRAGAWWKGIPHNRLVTQLEKGLAKRDIKIVDQHWFVEGVDDGKLTGSMELEIPGVKTPEGMNYSLGINHSNNRDYILRFAVGAKVFICSNGMVVGDFCLQRRHTSGFDLKEGLGDGLDRYLKSVLSVKDVVQNLKAREMSPEGVDRVLMEAGREKLLPWSRIGVVDEQWRKPRFSVFKERNGWSLYNAFTYTVQKCPAHEQMPAMNRFRELVLSN